MREFDGKRMEGDRIVVSHRHRHCEKGSGAKVIAHCVKQVEYAKRGPLSVRTRGGMRDRCYNCGESGMLQH